MFNLFVKKNIPEQDYHSSHTSMLYTVPKRFKITDPYVLKVSVVLVSGLDFEFKLKETTTHHIATQKDDFITELYRRNKS